MSPQNLLETFRSKSQDIRDCPTPDFFYTPEASATTHSSVSSAAERKANDPKSISYVSRSTVLLSHQGHECCCSTRLGANKFARAHRIRQKRLHEAENWLVKLKSVDRLVRIVSIILHRSQLSAAFQKFYRLLLLDTQQEVSTNFLMRTRLVAVCFRRWLQLVHKRTIAELRFLLRNASAENQALNIKLQRSIKDQHSVEMLLRQQRKETADLKDAVWSVWQNELCFGDRRHTRLTQCVRELTSITNELEIDRREKEPLLSIEFHDFFHRLLKHYKIQMPLA